MFADIPYATTSFGPSMVIIADSATKFDLEASVYNLNLNVSSNSVVVSSLIATDQLYPPVASSWNPPLIELVKSPPVRDDVIPSIAQ